MQKQFIMPTEADKIKELEDRVLYYECDGVAKLFYALNRKSAELADILNKHNLKNLDLSDPKDKTFDRMKIAWNESVSIAAAVKSLGELTGITSDEEKDTQTPKFRRATTPESVADNLGGSAGQK
jgi:hypothetical protein